MSFRGALFVTLFVAPSAALLIEIGHSGSKLVDKTGFTIDPQHVTYRRTLKSFCQCRLVCGIFNPRCVGYSFNPITHECLLTNILHTGVPSPNWRYVYTLPPGLPAWTKKADGLYYFLSQEKATLYQARQKCLETPEFRLAQAKTLQTMDIVRNKGGGAYFFDVERVSPSAPYLWGDGTPFNTTFFKVGEPRIDQPGSNALALAGTWIYDDFQNTTFLYLCQGNFDGVAW